MTIQIDLPKDVEDRLRAEVTAGRHSTVAEAILQKVSRSEAPDLLVVVGRDAAWLRADLDAAWLHREGAVEGDLFFARLADASASLSASGK